MRKNILAIATIGMLLLSSLMIMPTVIGDPDTGTIFYVGGSGPGNYTSIQDAVDNATNGDTVFVYNGTYYENIVVNTSISLIGENKETTIIEGGESGAAVTIRSNDTILSYFTIKNCSSYQYTNVLIINSENCAISDCIITDGYVGIEILDSFNNTIRRNVIRNLETESGGIWLCDSDSNDISENTLDFSMYAIVIDKSNNNSIKDNTISNCSSFGIALATSRNNIIENNVIENNTEGAILFISTEGHEIICTENLIIENIIKDNDGIGIKIEKWGIGDWESNNNTIYHNKFIDNEQNAYDNCHNNWNSSFGEGNYYSDYDEPSEGAYDNDSDGIVDTPYNISGGDNKDYYPLMEPWVEPAEDIALPVIHSIVPEKALYINNEKIGRTRLVRMALIIGDITIEVNATDNESGIKQVNFTIDPFRPFAKQEGNATEPNEDGLYNWTWEKDVIFRFLHFHIIKVEVIDNAGNIAEERMVVRRIL